MRFFPSRPLTNIVWACAVLVAGASSADGGVLAFGNNYNGRTGLGTFSGKTYIATPIVATNLVGKKITQVSAGRWHSLALAEDGSVFSFGEGANGETGLGHYDNVSIAMPIITTNLGARKIKQVAAGQTFSLLLADDGSVFSFGQNSAGQLGLGTMDSRVPVATPIDATNLGGRKITQIAAGDVYGLLLADDGTVFSMGSNVVGQTGLGTTSGQVSIATPIVTTNLGGRKITQVAAGIQLHAHSLLLAEDGSVFSFGANNAGQLGLGSVGGSTAIATPIDATNLGGRKITQISAGSSHSLLLADDGSAFAFGNFASGELGIFKTNPLPVPVATPIDTANLDGLKVTQVSAGRAYSLILAEDGRAFAFGSNSDGQLGIGLGIGNAFLPTPINMTNLDGQIVTQIDAGWHTNLLITEPALAGDFNNDGSVDAGDFIVWRKLLGQTAAALAADGDQDHQVDSDDYEVWRSHYGRTAGSASALAIGESLSTVPEPNSMALVLVGLVGAAFGRVRSYASAPIA